MDWNTQPVTPQEGAAEAAAARSRQEASASSRQRAEDPSQDQTRDRNQVVVPLTRAEAADLAGTLQSGLLGRGVSLTFKVLDEAGGLQVEIRDADSGRLIRKTPPDELLALARDLEKAPGGLLDRPA